MNGEYIITKGNIYYTRRPAGDKFSINNQNEVNFKVGSGNKIEGFENFLFTDDFANNVSSFFNGLGKIILEKGNFILMETTKGENIYIYNSLDKIPELDNDFIYSNILFENKEDMIRKKTEALCNFSFVNNIGNISNLAKLESIRTMDDFIQNIGNKGFIDSRIHNVDDKLLEDLFLLGKGAYIGRFGKLFMYPFLEVNGKLIPIYFDEENNNNFLLNDEKNFDKVDIISYFEGKNKISLFLDKIDSNIIIFNEDVIAEEDLQDFYTNLFLNTNYLNED